MAQAGTKVPSLFEQFAYRELAESPEKRTADFNFNILSSAELILHTVETERFVHVTVERPSQGDELISAISGLRKGGEGRPADRDGMLVFPNILEDGISHNLANRYLGKMEKVEDEADPDYNARDYLYLINAVSFSKHAMLEPLKDGPSKRADAEDLTTALAASAGQADKPMVVLVSEERMSFVGSESSEPGTPENLTNLANMEILICANGTIKSFSRDPQIIDLEEVEYKAA